MTIFRQAKAMKTLQVNCLNMSKMQHKQIMYPLNFNRKVSP